MTWIVILGISFGFYWALKILDPTKTQLDRMGTGSLIAAAASFIVLEKGESKRSNKSGSFDSFGFCLTKQTRQTK